MKRAELNQIVRYQGELCEVVSIGEGRTVHLKPLLASPCPTCGLVAEPQLLENSPLFQDGVEPVPTIADGGQA